MTTVTTTTYTIEVPVSSNYLVTIDGEEGLSRSEVLELLNNTPLRELNADLDGSSLKDSLRSADWDTLYVCNEDCDELT